MAGVTLTAGDGRLVRNLMHFGRVLRAAGLPVGPGRILEAIRAVRAVGIGDREDFYWALHAVLVNRRDQRELFDQAFHVFWGNPRILERMMALMLPSLASPESAGASKEEMSRRLADALAAGTAGDHAPAGEDRVELDAVMTWSDRELLQHMDFEKMSAAEMAEAKRVLARMILPIMDVPTRRWRADPAGRRTDLRATLRATLRQGTDLIPLKRRELRRRHPPLVILCDISGSMSRYSRMMLHFMHAVTNDRDRVHAFLFGTRLTNITRLLKSRDVDEALEKVGAAVEDWSGGTRIGACLEEFNRRWSRRVLAQGAVVLFISDGLDRDGAEGLAHEMERLHKSCRRLVWLNPLLRWDGYEPRSLGARAILPHVDEFRPVHNLESLADLAQVLRRPGLRREEGVSRWIDAGSEGRSAA